VLQYPSRKEALAYAKGTDVHTQRVESKENRELHSVGLTLICEKDLKIRKRDLGICKRDLGICKRDLGICKRDLGICKRDLGICKRDLGICKRDLGICKRDSRLTYIPIG